MAKVKVATFEEEKKDYQREMEKNEQTLQAILRRVRPELFVLLDLLLYTEINPLILYKIVRQLHNIAIGSKYGQVICKIENGTVTFVVGEDSDRVNEPILGKKS